jgi:RNA polymerase sigma-70 factor (ECF subfamily)
VDVNAALLTRVGMADSERFERLWLDHAGAVLRYAARRVPGAFVDDVVAETFTVAWRRLPEVPDPALPWLLGIARGVAANQVRSSRRQTALAAKVAAEPPRAPNRPYLTASTAILEAMATLSDDDREVLTLIAWDELEPREAAQVLGCSPAALRVRLHRARARLRRAVLETRRGHEEAGR